MATLTLKPTHKPVQAFYASLAKFEKLGVKHEGAVRSAFQELLDHCAGHRRARVFEKVCASVCESLNLLHVCWHPTKNI